MPLSRDGVLMQGAYALMQLGAPMVVPLVAASFLDPDDGPEHAAKS
jgi:hypothetical protein